MANQTPLYYDPNTSSHKPMSPSSDKITPGLIPISARQGNSIQLLGDGLYAGNYAINSIVYVDSAAGTDQPSSGSKANPYKTLDYAIQVNSVNGVLNVNLTILLKAGQQFPMNGRYSASKSAAVVIAWYGDPKYGDYPSVTAGGTVQSATMPDLQRPVIACAYSLVNNQVIHTGINMSFDAWCQLQGVQVNISGPIGTAPGQAAYGLQSDFITFVDGPCNGRLTTSGCIINKTDTATAFGFLGVTARCSMPSWAQYASQFRIQGVIVDATGATPDRLLARQWFIKFYTDTPGANQMTGTIAPTSANSTPGSGMLMANYSDVAAQTNGDGTQNIATFPVLADPSYGLRNYILGLNTDAQQKPLNFIVGRRM